MGRSWSLLGGRVTAIIFGGLVLAAAYGVYTATFGQNDVPSQTHVEITLTHPTLDSVPVSIPIEYLGPTFLELSKKNRLGGEQKKFLVQFFYPSFLPVTTKNDQVIKNERKVYISVGTGLPGGIRKFGERIPNRILYSSTGRDLCGLKEYSQIENNITNNTRYHGKYEKNNQSDVVFICDEDVYQVPCRVEMESPVRNNINISFYITFNGYRKKDLCGWKSFSQKVREFVNGFVLEGK